jgi:1-acyl-sn-glycerol-3-phosphate acyltransferase
MFKANHHNLYEGFFNFYIGWKLRKGFHKHRIAGDTTDPGGPILMIGNHISWWDGFWARRVNQQTYKRRFHVMMLEEQLRDRLFLSKMGAYSIKKNHRDALRSLHYTVELLHDEKNLVLLFPQGKFHSQYKHPINFEKGWFRIMQHAPANLRVVFLANLTDYYTHPKPTLSSYLHVADSYFPDAGSVEKAYNEFLHDAMNWQNEYESNI